MIKTLPPASAKQHVHTQVWVLPKLQISPYRPPFTSDQCQPYNEAGQLENFSVDTTPLGTGPFTYKWTVSPALEHTPANQDVFGITLPDEVGASVELTVRVTTGAGCSTTGSMTFQTISQEQAAFQEVLCRIQHTKLYAHLYPWQITPDPETIVQAPDRTYVPTAEELSGIRDLAASLVAAAETALEQPQAWTGFERRQSTNGRSARVRANGVKAPVPAGVA